MAVFGFPCSHDASITQTATFGYLNPPSKASGIAVAIFSSDEKFYTDYFIWQVVYGLPAMFDIISFRRICKIFVARKLYTK